MNITDFTTNIVTGLVKKPEMVKVSSFDADDEGIILEIIVSKDDAGSVIGYQGKNAKALRTVLQAYAYANNLGHIKINIDSF